MTDEERQKLDQLKEELITLNNEYNEKIDKVREIEEKINNYKPSKKIYRYIALSLLFVFGIDFIASIIEAYVPALSSILFFSLPFIAFVSGQATHTIYKKRNPGVNALKEELKKAKEEQNKLYPRVSKKREDYHAYRKLLESFDLETEKQVVTTNEDIVESNNYDEIRTDNINNIKVLSLTSK